MRNALRTPALAATLAAASVALAGVAATAVAASAPAKVRPLIGNVLVAPYVDMGLWPTANLSAMSRATRIGAFTAAFIVEQTTKPCTPAWGGYADYAVGGSGDFLPIITRFQKSGGTVIPSFGGAAGSELAENCTSESALLDAYASVVDRFSVSRVDFDIEGASVANSDANQRRARVVAQLQKRQADKGRPLAVSLTLPVMPSGLDANGLRTLKEFAAAGVDLAAVNVMAMDYGDSFTSMGTSAISAAKRTAAQMKRIPAFARLTTAQRLARVGITPMIGQNDVASEVFTVANAQSVAAFARASGVGMIAWWEMTRDRPCGGAVSGLSLCSGVDEPQWTYATTFVSALRG